MYWPVRTLICTRMQWRRLVKNIWGTKILGVGEKEVIIIIDESMAVSQLLGARARAAPKPMPLLA